MSRLLGTGATRIVAASDERGNPSWLRDDLFRLDTDNQRSGWGPRSRILGDGALLQSVWWEDTDLGWSGPNYAPWGETLRGPSYSRTLSAAASLAIYDSP